MIVSGLVMLKRVINFDLPSSEIVGKYNWNAVAVTVEDA